MKPVGNFIFVYCFILCILQNFPLILRCSLEFNYSSTVFTPGSWHHSLGRASHLHGSCIPERGGVVQYIQQRGFWCGQHDCRSGPDPKLLVPAGEIMGNTCFAVRVYTGSWLLTSVLGDWPPPPLSCCC